MRISHLGLPYYKDTLSHGDLFIHFEVIYPKILKPEKIKMLK